MREATDKMSEHSPAHPRMTVRLGGVPPSRTKRRQRAPAPRGPGEDTALTFGAFPDFRYHGGPVVRTPQVHALFVGNWSSTANQSRAARLGQFVKDMLNSEYMNTLAQYGCGISGTLESSVFIANTNTNLSADDVHALVQAAIDNGSVPDASARNVYLLVLDDVTGVNDSRAGAVMCEPTSDTAFGYHHFFETRSKRKCYFAVVPGLTNTCLQRSCPSGDATCTLQLTQSQEARQTQVISHELSELLSDPEVGSREGWTQPNGPHENGDICNGQSATIVVGRNTWTVQLMYSKVDDGASNGATTCVASSSKPFPSQLPLLPWQLPVGAVSGYVGDVPRVVYRNDGGSIHEIAIDPSTGRWVFFDMTAATGAPAAAGDPMGYLGEVPRVVYRGTDNHIHEIAIDPQAGNWGHFDMTAATGAPAAAGDPMGYLGEVPRVVFRGADRHVHEIAIYPQTAAWGDFDMSGVVPFSLAVGRLLLRAGNAAPPGAPLQGEYVAIANDSAWPAQLQGWTLRDVANHMYTFPNFVLESGSVVRIWTKAGNNDAGNLFWGHLMPLWNNTGDTAILRDSSGNEIDRITF